MEVRNWLVPAQEQVLTYPSPAVKLTNGVASYLHRDHLGSVRAITDAAGVKVESAVYKPFGEQTEFVTPGLAAPETKGWIGERYDADAGLQYLNARYYDPVLGMFLQPDWFEVLKPGVGTNRFSYSFNDPVNKLDPLGNEQVSGNFNNKEKGIIGRVFDAIRDALGGERTAAKSLASRYDNGEKTGPIARQSWTPQERRLNRAIRADLGCASVGGECAGLNGNSFREYDRKVGTVLDGIGTPGNGIMVEKGVGALSPNGGIASAGLNGTRTTLYGDYFKDDVKDSTRAGYIVHEAGHAYLGLTDQISRTSLATIGITAIGPWVRPSVNNPAIFYDVYGAIGRDAAIALGIADHNDRFVCSTGLRDGC